MLALAFPFLVKKLVGGALESLQNQALSQQVLVDSKQVLILLLGVLLVQAIIAFWRIQGFSRVSEYAIRDLRKEIYSYLLKLPLEYFHRHRSGEISNAISNDLAILKETLTTTLSQAGRQIVIFLGGLIAILMTSLQLSLWLLTVIPVILVLIKILGQKVRKLSGEEQDAIAQSQMVMEEGIQSILEVKAFTNEPLEKNRYESQLSKTLAAALKGAWFRAILVSFIIFILFGAIALVIWKGVTLVVAGNIQTEEFMAFILFSIFVGASLNAFPEIVAQLQKTAGATDRLGSLLREEIETQREGQLSVLDPTIIPKITWSSVHFSYPSSPNTPIIKGIDFELPPKKKIALVGSSGSGKSTIFSLILGLYRVTSGEIKVDGKLLQEVELTQFRELVAIVPQETLLFGGSVYDNIAYGNPKADEQAVYQAAQKAYADEFIEKLPEGYQTWVGARGVKLSGGQRQRISIARAILASPKLLLLDEATSALDSVNEQGVQEALTSLMENCTTLVIAHRLSTVKKVDEIWVIDKGKIIQKGTHQQLIEEEGQYRLLAKNQLID